MSKPSRFILPSRLDPEPKVVGSYGGQMAGYFKIEAIRPDGRRRLVAPWQSNLITNNGMNYWSTTNRDTYVNHQYKWLRWCRLGTGSAEPAFTDTDMDVFKAEVGYTSNSYNEQFTVEPYYKWTKWVYTFPQGAATGTITEIGIGMSRGYGQLSTRQLIRDTNGDPTSIIITADEQVAVTYELRMYVPDLTIYDSQGYINGVLYDIKSGPMNVDSGAGNWDRGNLTSIYGYSGTTLPNIGTVFTSPVSSYGNGGSVREAYVPNSYTQTFTLTVPYTSWNHGAKGMTALSMNGSALDWQFSFTQNLADYGIPHDNTNELFIRFRETWARYTPP